MSEKPLDIGTEKEPEKQEVETKRTMIHFVQFETVRGSKGGVTVYALSNQGQIWYRQVNSTKWNFMENPIVQFNKPKGGQDNDRKNGDAASSEYTEAEGTDGGPDATEYGPGSPAAEGEETHTEATSPTES